MAVVSGDRDLPVGRRDLMAAIRAYEHAPFVGRSLIGLRAGDDLRGPIPLFETKNAMPLDQMNIVAGSQLAFHDLRVQ